MTTTTQITDNGASLKIVTSGNTRLVLKSQIREISIINDTIIKLDKGENPLNNIFINYADVDNPATTSPEVLRDAINDMLHCTCGGATPDFTEMARNVNLLNNKIFYQPIMVDESTPNVVYRGFAMPGARTSDAVWAVQKITKQNNITNQVWAAGNQNLDKKWDDRATLTYA